MLHMQITNKKSYFIGCKSCERDFFLFIPISLVNTKQPGDEHLDNVTMK